MKRQMDCGVCCAPRDSESTGLTSGHVPRAFTSGLRAIPTVGLSQSPDLHPCQLRSTSIAPNGPTMISGQPSTSMVAATLDFHLHHPSALSTRQTRTNTKSRSDVHINGRYDFNNSLVLRRAILTTIEGCCIYGESKVLGEGDGRLGYDRWVGSPNADGMVKTSYAGCFVGGVMTFTLGSD